MKNHRFPIALWLIGLMLGFVSLFLPMPAAAAPKGTVWKMQQIYGPTNYQSIELKRFAKDVAARTN